MIGGLVMSTVATLLVIPSIFAIVIGKSAALSPSLYSGDKESKHFDSHLDGNSVGPGELEFERLDRKTFEALKALSDEYLKSHGEQRGDNEEQKPPPDEAPKDEQTSGDS